MNVLKPEKRLAVLSALVEGCSIQEASRMTGVPKTTIMRLLGEVGEQRQSDLDARLRGRRCDAVECGELWTFIYKKQRRVSSEDRTEDPDHGDAYAFIAFDPDSRDWTITERLRIFAQARESEGCLGLVVVVLQFLPPARLNADYTRNGARSHGSCLVAC
jgi:transposase